MSDTSEERMELLNLLMLLGLIWLILSCAILAITEALYSFIIGMMIAFDKQALSIPATIANILLVINLCEPLVNTFLIAYVGLHPAYQHAPPEQPFHRAIWLATPMLILCLPLGGLLLKEACYRNKCLQIFVLGMARWPIVVVAWTSFDNWIISILVALLGFKVLWSSIAMGKRELARLKAMRESEPLVDHCADIEQRDGTPQPFNIHYQ
jgi:hypothetical protein